MTDLTKLTPGSSSHLKWSVLFACSLTMTACGDIVSGTGEFGKVNYSLYTVYLSETSAIQQSKLLVGHPQTITTELTLKGSREIEDPTTLTHIITHHHSSRPGNHVSRRRWF